MYNISSIKFTNDLTYNLMRQRLEVSLIPIKYLSIASASTKKKLQLVPAIIVAYRPVYINYIIILYTLHTCGGTILRDSDVSVKL